MELLPCVRGFKRSPASTRVSSCYRSHFVARLPPAVPGSVPGYVGRVATTAYRESLCASSGITARAPHSRRGSPGVIPTSSLIRTHAPDRVSPIGFGCPYSFGSLRVVSSPCCHSALPDVIPAILVPAPGSVPRHSQTVHLSVSSRPSRPHHRVNQFGSWNTPAKQFYAGGIFRGCNHSLMFRLRYSLGPQTVPTFRAYVPAAAGPSRPPGESGPGSIRAVTGRKLRHCCVSESDN
jgi:hypothetical protein